MKGAAILAASIAFCDRVVATTTAPTPSPKDDDDYNGSTALFVICSLLLMIGFLVGMYLYSIQPKAPEPHPEETPTPPDLEAELLDLLREYRRIATEIRDVGQAMARRAWADTRQGQFWQEGESHFESHHGEIKEESNEDLTALLAKLKATEPLAATLQPSFLSAVLTISTARFLLSESTLMINPTPPCP